MVAHAASAKRVAPTNRAAKSNPSKQDRCCVHEYATYIIAILFERSGSVILEGSGAVPPVVVFTDR